MQASKYRDQKIMAMRASKQTFVVIGKSLGISPQRAHQIVKRIERKNPTSGVEKVS